MKAAALLAVFVLAATPSIAQEKPTKSAPEKPAKANKAAPKSAPAAPAAPAPKKLEGWQKDNVLMTVKGLEESIKGCRETLARDKSGYESELLLARMRFENQNNLRKPSPAEMVTIEADAKANAAKRSFTSGCIEAVKTDKMAGLKLMITSLDGLPAQPLARDVGAAWLAALDAVPSGSYDEAHRGFLTAKSKLALELEMN
jgi:TolA-binding protein